MNSPTRRFMLLAPLALSVLCGLMVWSLQLGSVVLSWRQTMAALGLSSAPLSGMLDTIIVQLRVPRALLAALTGAGLAMTGALLQTTTRNELADPFCLVSPQAPPPARCWSSRASATRWAR